MRRYKVFQSKIYVAFYIYDTEDRYSRIIRYELWALRTNTRIWKRLTRKIIEEYLIVNPPFGVGQLISSVEQMLEDCVSGSGKFKVVNYEI